MNGVMSYRSLYLTYRPQTFDQVAGQKTIVRTLQNALKNDKIGHSYLFTGPRGTGKTSMARLFAKAINCEEGIGHQCCHCSNCIAIAESTHPDVVEIDAASNNGVEQVRDLIDRIKYAPIKGRMKIYIIDEVHMMSAGAFNALLKTLEEPPDNVVFILCTTEPQKVLPTIVSRCQRYDFSKVGEEDMRNKLIEVLNEEKSSYEEAGIDEIVGLSDGGMRDALSILDQVLAYSDNSLYQKDVLELFGLASTDEKLSIIEDIETHDVSSLKRRFDSYASGGVDLKKLAADLIVLGKDGLIYAVTKDISLIKSMNAEQVKRLLDLAPLSELKRITYSLVSLQNDFRLTSDIRSLFELRLLSLATDISEDKPVVEKAPITTIKKEEAKPIEKPKAAVPSFLLEEDEPLFPEDKKPEAKKEQPEEPKEEPKPILDASKISKLNIATSGDKYHLDEETIFKIQLLADKLERQRLVESWGQLTKLKSDPNLGNLATLLSQGNPFCLCKQALILAFSFTSLKDKANIKENQKPIQELVAQLLGRTVFVYGIDANERVNSINYYSNKVRLNKSPNKKDIVIDLPTD